MWRGALCGLLLVCAKIVFDIVRGVGVPTTYLQQDRHLFGLLRAHPQPPDTVKQLDALVGAFLNGQQFDQTRLKAMLSNAPEPIRIASEELLGKL
jgi:hypothetical protein